MGKIKFNKEIKSFFESQEYKSLNLTTRDVYELIYKSFLASVINFEKGNDDWKDDLGIFCRYNQSLIAKKLNKSLRTISNAIKKLKDLKLIHVVEIGKRQTAKIYVKPVSVTNIKYEEVKIENAELNDAFQQTFNEEANYKEAHALNNMINLYTLADLIAAVKKSVNVKFKKARISYITKTIKSLKNQSNVSHQKIKRKELVPDWLNLKEENDKKEPISYELTVERRKLISKIQDMSLIRKDINLYSNEEIEALIKMQEMKKMLLN